MGHSLKEGRDGVTFYVAIINARKCLTYKKMTLELFEAFNVPAFYNSNLNARIDGILDTIYDANCNVVIIINKMNTITEANRKELLASLYSYKKQVDKFKIATENVCSNNFIIEY